MKVDLKAIPRGFALNKEGLCVPDSCVKMTASIACYYPDGSLKQRINQPARSFVRWFGRFLEAVCDGSNASIDFDVIDTNNQPRNHIWRGPTGAGPIDAVTNHPQMGFGTGLVPPASADYSLGIPLQGLPTRYNTNVVLQEDANGSVLTISALAINTGKRFFLSEITLESTWKDSGDATKNAWISARDVFPAVQVDPNETFSGTYSIILSI